MPDPYLFTVTNNVASFSINDSPSNLMREALPACRERWEAYAIAMILRGRKIDGAEAHRIGLVTELLPLADIKARAQALGEELASQPRQAVKSMLEVIVGHETRTLEQSMADEIAAVAANRGTPDSMEGMRAFMEKREPVFNRKSP